MFARSVRQSNKRRKVVRSPVPRAGIGKRNAVRAGAGRGSIAPHAARVGFFKQAGNDRAASIKRVVKYGNSQAVVLPREITEAAGLSVGCYLEIRMENGHIEMKPVEFVPHLSGEDREFLDDLYAKRERVFKKLAE